MNFWQNLSGRQRRLILSGVGGLILITLLFISFRSQSVLVDYGEVTRGELFVSVRDEGQTRVKEIYTVSAPIAGRLMRVEASAGDKVQAFQTVLATIQPTSPSFLDVRTRAQAESAVKVAEAALSLAEAEVARTEAELEFAESEFARAETLFKRGNIAESALDRTRLEVKTKISALRTAEAAFRVKEFELQTARASLIDPGNSERPDQTSENCCIPIYAPIDGKVLQVLHKSEGVVAAGTDLMQLGDPSQLEVVVDLLSTDAVRVSAGDLAFLENWGRANTLEARVRKVEPYGFTKISALGVEEQRVNVVLDLVEENVSWESLGHGFRVETRIITWRGEDIVRVPLGALFRDQRKQAVFLIEDGMAVLRHVDVGQMNENFVEVIDGLEVGDRVIMHPSDLIYDGVSVSLRPIGETAR